MNVADELAHDAWDGPVVLWSVSVQIRYSRNMFQTISGNNKSVENSTHFCNQLNNNNTNNNASWNNAAVHNHLLLVRILPLHTKAQEKKVEEHPIGIWTARLLLQMVLLVAWDI